MKRKIMMTAAIVAFGFTASAQRPVDENPFSFEGGLSLSGTTFDAPTVKLRYFAADNMAVRVGLSMENSSTTTNFYGTNDDGDIVESKLGTEISKSSMTWLSVGGSYHFSQLEKLSPYAALDIMIGSGSTKVDGDNTDGSSYDDEFKYSSTSKSSGLGLNIATGFDYYFAQNVFIGAELGFMMMNGKDKGGNASATVASTTVSTDTFSSGSSSSFGNSASGSIRLGWRF